MIGLTNYMCGSCAVSSISNVGGCKNPVDVLEKFCKTELGEIDSYRKVYSKLVCYYVWCAGPEVKSTEPGGSHHSKDHWPRYGTELAQYIVDHKLGDVVTLGPKHNIKHHPSTTAQVWAWSPDQKAMEDWWTKRQKRLI